MNFSKRLSIAGLLLPLLASCFSPRPVGPGFATLELPLPPPPVRPRLALDVSGFLKADTLSLGGVAIVPAAGPPASPYAARSPSDEDLRCLTEAVYYEARSEGPDGQRAVAQVVLNRVRHPQYPASICGVVYEGSERATGCQFSFTCDGSRSRRIERFAWADAQRVAQDALNGYVHAPVGYATHYHTDEVQPSWSSSLTRIGAFGEHIFYRWRGPAGEPAAFVRG